MSLAMLFLLPARHAVKHKFWGPVLAAVVEQLGLLAVAAQAWMAKCKEHPYPRMCLSHHVSRRGSN